MIALPEWMTLFQPDGRPESEHPPQVRELLQAIRASGPECRYAGETRGTEVYLVRSGSSRARLALDRAHDSVELWSEPVDPNSAPIAWAYRRAMSPVDIAGLVRDAL